MIYRAIVRNTKDPAKKGRIKVVIPSQSGKALSDWIWPVVTSGYIVTPKPGEQVWVLFENGDNEVPVWLGKTDVTKTGITKTNVGYATILQRIEALETKVKALEDWVDSHG